MKKTRNFIFYLNYFSACLLIFYFMFFLQEHDDDFAKAMTPQPDSVIWIQTAGQLESRKLDRPYVCSTPCKSFADSIGSWNTARMPHLVQRDSGPYKKKPHPGQTQPECGMNPMRIPGIRRTGWMGIRLIPEQVKRPE